MMTCEEVIETYLASLKEAFACSAQENGRLCVVTPYLYPDHDNVEIFVREKPDGSVMVSDLGETLRRLDTVGMDVTDRPALSFTVSRIAGGFGVTVSEGILLKQGQREAAGQLVFDVLSTCKAVGDLLYGSRAYRPATFQEEVTDYLRTNDVPFEEDFKIKGKSGTDYTVSLRAHASQGGVLVDAVSGKSQNAVKRTVDSTFRKWSDINSDYADRRYKISLLDDDSFQFRKEDQNVLQTVSTVYRWKERAGFLTALKATG